MDVAKKTVFITGGGGGIGGGMAQAFAEKGARIVLADINPDFARQEADKLPQGTPSLCVTLDVCSEGSWRTAQEEVSAKFGEVDILCNNAGISPGFKPLLDTDPKEFDRVMAINVTGVYNGIRAFAPQMVKRRSGHIVNTSSLNGLLPFGSFATYSASKFAVLGLSDSLREELEPAGVGVSVLFPGLTRSRMSEQDTPPAIGNDPERVAAFHAMMMDPVWLGRAVVRAVENNDPYIITHPDHLDSLTARHARIVGAFGEPAQPGYLQRPWPGRE